MSISTTTFKERLTKAGLNNKDGKMSERAKKAMDIIQAQSKLMRDNEIKLYLKAWSGNGRHRTLIESRYNLVIDFLNALKIKYETGNDAPRGGVEGDYIRIAKRNLTQFKGILYDLNF